MLFGKKHIFQKILFLIILIMTIYTSILAVARFIFINNDIYNNMVLFGRQYFFPFWILLLGIYVIIFGFLSFKKIIIYEKYRSYYFVSRIIIGIIFMSIGLQIIELFFLIFFQNLCISNSDYCTYYPLVKNFLFLTMSFWIFWIKIWSGLNFCYKTPLFRIHFLLIPFAPAKDRLLREFDIARKTHDYDC